MLHSVCFISRAYPDPRWPGLGDALVEREAQLLAAAGVAVHVITGGGDGAPTSLSADGLTIHRLPEPAQAGHPELGYIAAATWSQSVGLVYRDLDTRVRFDLVRVTDTFAATLHFGQYKRPETPVVGSLWAADDRLLSAPAAPATPGEAAFQALNLVAAEQFDVLLAASNTTIDVVRARLGRAPDMRLLTPPLSMPRGIPARRRSGGAVRLAFVGTLDPASRADLAIEALAAAHEAGLDARLVLAGAPGFTTHGRPYRKAVLEPLISERRLGRWVRFAGDLDVQGVQRLLRQADCAIMPGFEPLLHRAAIAALGHGVPVLVGPTASLPQDAALGAGVVVCRTESAAAFSADAVRNLAHLAPLQHASRQAADRLRATCARPAWTRRYLATLTDLAERAPRPKTTDRAPLSVVVLATDPISTRRTLAGILAHTPRPVQVYVVLSRSDRGLARCVRQFGSAVTRVECPPDASDAERRSLGLAAAAAEQQGAIAVLARGTEVHAGWYWRSLDALDRRGGVGIVRQAGPVSAYAAHVSATLSGADADAELASSCCTVVDAAVARQLGTFDPRVPVFWQDADYGLRARRLGYSAVAGSSGDRFIPGSKDDELLDADTHAYLAARWQRLRDGIPDARQVLVVALADEVRAEPDLLSAYAQAFSSADDVTLAIYAPDADAVSVERDLAPGVEHAGLAADDSADVLLLPLPREESEEGLAHAAHAVLSNVPANGPLATLPRFDAAQIQAIRSLVERCQRRAA